MHLALVDAAGPSPPGYGLVSSFRHYRGRCRPLRCASPSALFAGAACFHLPPVHYTNASSLASMVWAYCHSLLRQQAEDLSSCPLWTVRSCMVSICIRQTAWGWLLLSFLFLSKTSSSRLIDRYLLYSMPSLWVTDLYLLYQAVQHLSLLLAPLFL